MISVFWQDGNTFPPFSSGGSVDRLRTISPMISVLRQNGSRSVSVSILVVLMSIDFCPVLV